MTAEEILQSVEALCSTGAKFSITFDLAWKIMKDIMIQDYPVCYEIAGKYIDLFFDFQNVVEKRYTNP